MVHGMCKVEPDCRPISPQNIDLLLANVVSIGKSISNESDLYEEPIKLIR